MKILLTIGFAFLMFSCASKELQEEVTTLVLDATQAQEVKLSSFVKKLEFLKLSSEQNSFIGDIEKIEITADRIYILDARQSIALYVYGRDGALHYKIANYGSGPGEFMGPYDFVIDKDEEQIIIYDARAIKLSFYNLSDGGFIKDKNLDFRFGRFAVTKQNYIFFLNNIATNFNHNIIITDKHLNIVDKKLKIDPNMMGYHFSLPVNFSHYNSYIYFTAPSDYTIYRIGIENSIFEEYKSIDFGENMLSESYFKKHPDNRSRRAEIGDAAFHVSNYFESDKFFFFRYNKGEAGNHYYLKSKESGNSIHAVHEKLIDDVGVGPLIVWPNTIEENTLVWFQDSVSLLRYLHKKKNGMSTQEWASYANKHSKLISFAQTLSAEDNPYLIFMEIDL